MTIEREYARRARALLARLDEAPLVMARIGLDTAKVQEFRRDARADLWLVDADKAEMQLTVRARTAADALAELHRAAAMIWPEATS